MQSNTRAALAEFLQHGLDDRDLNVDDLADRTKVSRTTIQALLDEPPTGLIPERVYLRGHLSVVARELRIDCEEALRLFDLAFVEAMTTQDLASAPRFGTGSVALAAGLAGVAILAVVLAFASALN